MQMIKIRATLLVASIAIAMIVSVQSTLSAFNTMRTIPSSGSIGFMRPLHTDGRWVKDDLGNIVVLKGLVKVDHTDTAVGWWTTPGEDMAGSNYANWNEAAVRAHFQVMKQQWGVNVVSILFTIDWWIRNARETISAYAPVTDRGARDSIIDVVRIAQEYGIYVILWAYAVKVSEGRTFLPFPPYHDGSVIPSVQAFADFWVSVARDVANYPNVLFSLYDEPFTPTGIPTEWFDAAALTVNALRNASFNNLVVMQWAFAGSFDWVDQWVQEGRPTQNILFTNNIYRWHGTFENNPNSPTDINYIRRQLTDPTANWPLLYAHVITDLNLPIHVGGIGAFNGVSDDAEYDAFRNSLTVLNELRVGYEVLKWHRSDTAWAVQQHIVDPRLGYVPAIQPPNRVGQALIDAIANATI